MQDKMQQRELEQQAGSKYDKEYLKAVYHHPSSLSYMQSKHVKCQAG